MIILLFTCCVKETFGFVYFHQVLFGLVIMLLSGTISRFLFPCVSVLGLWASRFVEVSNYRCTLGVKTEYILFFADFGGKCILK